MLDYFFESKTFLPIFILSFIRTFKAFHFKSISYHFISAHFQEPLKMMNHFFDFSLSCSNSFKEQSFFRLISGSCSLFKVMIAKFDQYYLPKTTYSKFSFLNLSNYYVIIFIFNQSLFLN